MATPSSSATSPSPPMAYLQPIVPASQGPSSSSLSSLSPSADAGEGERRKKAVQKFLARAELSNVTRTLRTRLSYASTKTNPNHASTSFGDLDAQTQSTSSTAPGARSYAAKRKAPSQPSGNAMSPLRRGSLGPRPRTPASTGNVGASTSSAAESNTQTLFTSILAPPPPNQARTILNANDPPLAAPVRPAMSPKVRNLNNSKAVKSIAESTRAHAKSSRRQPDKRKDKGKSRKAVDGDGDVDMEAAATLTSLLLHHRPSIAGSASSPRSSIDGSEVGTPYSQQPQSARSSFSSILPSNNASNASTSYRSKTPPRSLNSTVQQQQQQGQTTPHPAPTDNEAADLMLFLATSPSPARPTTSKDARDAAAFRVLAHPSINPSNSNMMRANPRVLFPTQGEFPDDPGVAHRSSSGTGIGLARSDSFANPSISSNQIDTEVQGYHTATEKTRQQHTPVQQSQQQLQASSLTQGAHLLPPPSIPPSQRHTASSFPSSPSSLRNESSPRPEHPVAGGQSDFNFGEYIHASPTRPGSGSGHSISSQKANLGLRADVGRKLFEEEQVRLQQMRRPEDRNLEAGIDLVRT